MKLDLLREYLTKNPFIVIMLLGGAIMAVCLMLYEPSSSSSATGQAAVKQQIVPQPTLPGKKTPQQGAMPKGSDNTGKPMINPFQAPDDYLKAVNPNPLPNAASQPNVTRTVSKGTVSEKGSSAKPEAKLPVVEGFATSGDSYLAIIDYNGFSRPYAVGEMVGPYKITQILNGSVTVVSPAGRLELKMRGL